MGWVGVGASMFVVGHDEIPEDERIERVKLPMSLSN